MSVDFLVCIQTLLLLIWFRSEAWVEYCKLFKLNYISKYKEYDEVKKEDVRIDYHTFLKNEYNNFFVRLLTCPICFSVWSSLIVCITSGSIIFYPIVIVFGLILYGILNILLSLI
jgi:hypothetical protein